MAETYTSGAINFTGLGDGTDFNQLVDSLVNVEQRRVTRLETWKSSWAQKNTQFKDLNTQMLSLKTTLEKLDTVNEFMSKSVSSADTSIITATANSDAQQGAHVIEVGQLASSDVQITASGVSSLSTAVTTTNTNFTFSYAGETHTISNISANTSLSTFVNIINTHPESSGVIRASTILTDQSITCKSTALIRARIISSSYQTPVTSFSTIRISMKRRMPPIPRSKSMGFLPERQTGSNAHPTWWTTSSKA